MKDVTVTGFRIIPDNPDRVVPPIPKVEPVTLINKELFRNVEVVLFNGNPRKKGGKITHDPVPVDYNDWWIEENRVSNKFPISFLANDKDMMITHFAIRDRGTGKIYFAEKILQPLFTKYFVTPEFPSGSLTINFDTE